MAGICTSANSAGGCSHWQPAITRGGVTRAYEVTDAELLTVLTEEEQRTFDLLAMRLLRQSGVTLPQFLNRVTHGEEATNVKAYDLIAPGAAVTKPSIGTTYVNILPGLTAQRRLIDFRGCSQFRVVMSANLVSTGPFGLKIVRDSDGATLFEVPSFTQTGERELDSDFQNLPTGFSTLMPVRLMARSVVASDSPVFRACTLVVL